MFPGKCAKIPTFFSQTIQNNGNSKKQFQAADFAKCPDGHTDNIHEQRRHPYLSMPMGEG
jgi:hypothetical protein